MKLFQLYLKLTIRKNLKYYLYCILSIIIYINFCFIIALIVNRIYDSAYGGWSYLRITYGSIQTIFTLLGMVILLNLYYRFLNANTSNYGIIKALGASGKLLGMLIISQGIMMIIATVPLGFAIGVAITDCIIKLIPQTMFRQMAALESSMDITITTAMVCISISIIVMCAVLNHNAKENVLIRLLANER